MIAEGSQQNINDFSEQVRRTKVPETGKIRADLVTILAPHYQALAQKMELSKGDVAELNYSLLYPTLEDKAEYLLILAKTHFGKKRETFQVGHLIDALTKANLPEVLDQLRQLF